MQNPEDVAAFARELSTALMAFHKALLLAEAGDDPALRNPYTLLFAAINDPRFAWTGRLSQLIVRLDEMADEGEISTPAHLAPFREEISNMLGGKGKENAEFRLRHLIALQNAPDVALATGGLRGVLARLPVTRSGQDKPD